LKANKLIAQKLPKASEVGEPPHFISHSSEANVSLGVKLQSGKELLD
jgi:hypothetical protein